ncbi:hypothetical protein Tco_1264016 [Tanacetum coccineum]
MPREIMVYEMGGDQELFTSEAWKRAFDINEPFYTKLCHEFYATFEFDEVVPDDVLMTKKVIKFRLGGRAHSLTVLKFARHLGLYNHEEILDDGFETYFLGGLRNDNHFNANQYWLSISSEEELLLSRISSKTIRNLKNNLWLLSMFEAKHQDGYANVAWLIAKWLKRNGVGTQKESMICCGQFVTKIAKRLGVLTDEVLNGLSAPTYYRSLDAITLKELIYSNGRLIPEDPSPSVPRFAMSRAPRPTINDLYDRMGRLEIRQGRLCTPSYFEEQHQQDEE